MVDDIVNTTEVVDGFHDVVDAGVLRSAPQGARLKDVTGLLLGQSAALDMIGIVSQVNLDAMVNAAFHPHLLLFAQSGKQGRHLFLAPFRQSSLSGNVPGLSREEGSLYLPRSTVITGGTFADAVFFGKLTD